MRYKFNLNVSTFYLRTDGTANADVLFQAHLGYTCTRCRSYKGFLLFGTLSRSWENTKRMRKRYRVHVGLIKAMLFIGIGEIACSIKYMHQSFNRYMAGFLTQV